MSQTHRSTETCISLQRGQAHWEQLRQGALIRVTTGSLVVSSHVWLENTLVKHTNRVTAGGMYGVAACGWFELAAQTDVELFLLAPIRATPMASLMSGHWLRRLVDRIVPIRLAP